jgi:hypothetical protein
MNRKPAALGRCALNHGSTRQRTHIGNGIVLSLCHLPVGAWGSDPEASTLFKPFSPLRLPGTEGGHEWQLQLESIGL